MPAILKRGGKMGIRTPSHPGTMQLACAPFCGIDLATFLENTQTVYAFHVRLPIEPNFPGEVGDPTIVWYKPPGWGLSVPGFAVDGVGGGHCFYPKVSSTVGYVDVVVSTSDPAAKAANFELYWANTAPDMSPHSVFGLLNQCMNEHP